MFYAAQGCLAVMVLTGMVYVQKQVHYLWAVICYFCDTADLESAKTYSKYYADNPLWDGEGSRNLNMVR